MKTKRHEQTIGDRIAIARGFYQMSQADLAKRLQLTRAAVSQYEMDQIMPRRQVVERLTEIFGSSTGWFELGAGLPPRPPERTVAIAEIDGHLVTRKVQDLRQLRGQREWGVPGSLFARHEINPEALVVMYAPDDTLAPEIRRGDHVVIDLARTTIDNGIFLLIDENDQPSLQRFQRATRARSGKSDVRGRIVGVFRMLE